MIYTKYALQIIKIIIILKDHKRDARTETALRTRLNIVII